MISDHDVIDVMISNHVCSWRIFEISTVATVRVKTKENVERLLLVAVLMSHWGSDCFLPRAPELPSL